jgi:hypothetical protein
VWEGGAARLLPIPNRGCVIVIDLDLKKLFDADPGIPALEIFGEMCALEEYLKALDDRLPNIQDQTRLRLEAELRHSYPSLAEDPSSEYLNDIRTTASTTLPRFFVGGALVAVWALYEAAVEEIAGYIRRKEQIRLSLKDLKGDFNDQSRKYFADVLRYPLPYDDATFGQLSRLSMLRVCFAHDNGNLRPERIKDIEKNLEGLSGAVVIGNHLSVTVACVLEFFRLVEKCLEALLDAVISRYVANRNP